MARSDLPCARSG